MILIHYLEGFKMKSSNKTTLNLTKRIFNQPTAPFYEKFVLDEIKTILKENHVPFFTDSVGQVIAGVRTPQELKKKRRVAFFAHTDHPGFHVIKQKTKNLYLAKWFGGAPFEQMESKNVRIWSYDSNQEYIKGKIKKVEKKGNSKKGVLLEIQTQRPLLKEKSYWGAFDFDGFQLKNNLISTKCADDLAGCVMALGAILDDRKKNVLAVFTRAEEVGFIGCMHLMRSRILSPETLVISLEASRTLPGALLGHGPVIRLGDATTLFDRDFSLFMQSCAQALKKKDKSFNFQKKLMDGGSCEATALSQAGFKTMGLAVPLANYHNQGPNGPVPEKIHLKDLENGRKLLGAVSKDLAKFPKARFELNKRLKTNYDSLKKYLNLKV